MQDHSTDPDRLYWDEIVARGREIAEAADSSSWELGRLAEQVEVRYGEADLQKYADLIGVTYDSLRDYRYVTSRFADRSARVSFTVMRQLARLDDPAERAEWLARAEREGWTVSRAITKPCYSAGQ